MTYTNRLSAQRAARLTTPGRHADGRGLYLNVTKNGGRSWVLLYRFDGRMRELGLGPFAAIGLKDARDLAEAARTKIRNGIDPISERKAQRAGRVGVPTFGALALEIAADRAATWKSVKHREQWLSSLTLHAAPLMNMPVNLVDENLILMALRPMTKGAQPRLATAKRVLNRIEAVLAVATVRRFRSGPNPAVWRGNFDVLLPALKRMPRAHHSALPVAEMPAFMAELEARGVVSATALRFVILTAARSAEVRFATWGEIDFATATWSIPGLRMKSGRPHRVPLSSPAMAILKRQRALSTSGYIFPGRKLGTPLAEPTFAHLLARMGRSDITVHGTARACFRTWASEIEKARFEVAEMALAHRVGGATVHAYSRGDHLEERRQLMAAWADFLEGEAEADATPLRSVS